MEILIVGAGGHGREIHDVILAINAAASAPVWDFIGFIDDGNPDHDLLHRRHTRSLGGVEQFQHLSGVHFVVGIGDSAARRDIDGKAQAQGLIPATLIHPSATLGHDVRLEVGAILCSQVSVTTNVLIGVHTHLNSSSTIGHDAIIGNYVTINPGATVSGNVRLDDDVVLGTNCSVIQGVHIGARSIVGAGAAVIRDLPNDVVAVGVPARPLQR